MQKFDVLVGGQGAAAFAAALYLARYRLSTVVAGGTFGGETAIGGTIENYPGTPDIDGYDLMAKFKEQVDALEVPIVMSDISEVKRAGSEFVCTLANGDQYSATSVILAIGRERRKLGLPMEAELTGKGVAYCSTCDAPLYRGKDAVGVVGGGNAAVEGAVLLAKYVKQVYLIYRGDKLYRPEPILLDTLKQTDNVAVLYKTTVTELIANELGLTDIRISAPHEGKDVLTVDGLFVEAGADPRTEIPKALGLELNSETGEVHVGRAQETNVAGIYAAGDLTDGASLKQTITAASQGAIAALSAYQHVLEAKVAR